MVSVSNLKDLAALADMAASVEQAKRQKVAAEIAALHQKRDAMKAPLADVNIAAFPGFSLDQFNEWRRKELQALSMEEAQLRAKLEPLNRQAARAEARAAVLAKMQGKNR